MATTAEYQTYLNSPEWQTKRRKILKRAYYKCEKCRKAKPLQVHHLTYEWEDGERSDKLDNLLAVCDRCHRRLHGIRPWWVRGLKAIWRWVTR